MIAFKKMWEDVNHIMMNNKDLGINVIDNCSGEFAMKNSGDSAIFLTKEDFVDVWCHMQYYNKVFKGESFNITDEVADCIYSIIRELPYIKEEDNELTINM